MAGYNGFSMSNNAVDAYERGLRPASKLKGGIPASLIEKFVTPWEWHHSSKEYNRVNFYNPDEVEIVFGLRQPTEEDHLGYEVNPAAVAALAASKTQTADVRFGTVTYAWWSGSKSRPVRHVSTFTGQVEFKGDWAIFDGRRIKLSGGNYEGFKESACATA